MSKIGSWVDVVSGEVMADGGDRYGVPLLGEDEEGFWWGTDAAPFVLSEQYYTVTVSGTLGSEHWFGHFVGTEEEAIDFAERRGVVVDCVETGEV